VSELKWIKLAVNTFNTSRKIKQIALMPNGDTILIIWVMLLCMAGDINDGGAIYITPTVPYTDKSLADELHRPLKIVQKALDTFETYGMIDRSNGIIQLVSWSKYQSCDGVDRVKEQTRQRVAKHRQKQSECNANVTQCNVTSNATVTLRNAIEEEKEEEEEKEKEYSSFLSKETPQKNVTKERYKNGEIGQGVVKLTDAQLDEILDTISCAEFEKYANIVADMELQGKRYTKKSHCKAIIDMALKDRKVERKTVKKVKGGSFDTDDFFEAALKRSYGE
jgi:predicted phage replisome organizer